MANTNTPDGFVFVPRAAGVAAELLNAANKIKADRKLDVRSVTGGYHVRKNVAEEYQKAFPEAEIKADAEVEVEEKPEGGLPVTADSSVKEIDEYAASLTPPVDVSEAKNRAEKIEILKAANDPASAE
ncbi:MAG: hypothetical protein ACTHXC_00420 [Brachybacterium sp.]